MKRLATGDVHLSGFLDDSLDKNGLPERLGRIIDILKFGLSYCKKNDIHYFDILGDLINDKDVIYNDSINLFKDLILDNPDITFSLISGNHDQSSAGETQRSAISIFSGYKNVKCITEVEIIDNITMMPFTHDLFNRMKEVKASDIFLGHFGLNEAMLQSGLSVKTDVKIKDLSKFKLVLLGHYHKPQSLGHVHYVGNPSHLNWNDKNEEKRFIEYDTKTLEIKSIPITGYSEYREYVIESAAQSGEILAKAILDKKEGHKVRIRKMFSESMENTSDLMIIEKPKELDVTNRGMDLTSSLKEKLIKYMEYKELPELERSKYLQFIELHSLAKI